MKQFPSPRGDKLCLIAIFEKNLKTFLFPSPRGDKLCRGTRLDRPMRRRFPSPRGDKLCLLQIKSDPICKQFPSPRGDKLCLKTGGISVDVIIVSVPSRG